MIDETSDIARTDTVEYWETCAKEAGSENGGLQFALDYWIAVANVIKRQRDSAEKERDALRKDAARLDWMADDPVFEGFVHIPLDVYEFENIVAEQHGRIDPNENDRREAFRRMIDAAMEAK